MKYNRIRNLVHAHISREGCFSDMYLERPTYLLTRFATKTSNRGNNHGIFHYQKLKSKQSLHLGGLRVKCAMEILYECSSIWKYEITAICPKFDYVWEIYHFFLHLYSSFGTEKYHECYCTLLLSGSSITPTLLWYCNTGNPLVGPRICHSDKFTLSIYPFAM